MTLRHKSRTAEARASVRTIALLCAIVSIASGCSIQNLAVNKLADTLAKTGTTFSSDEDPDLVGDALPFSLKLIESVLAETPRHEGLLLAAASGFTQYAYAWVQDKSDRIESSDFDGASALRDRAKRLYVRARNYGLRGLDVRHRAFSDRVRADPKAALAQLSARDVPLLYWTAAAWGAAISVGKDDADLVADVALVEAMIDRALALDEGFDRGAIHSFLISYEMARQGSKDAPGRAREHFDRAVVLSDGKLAGPYVTMAESVAVPTQNRAEFESLLSRALEIDLEAQPESRLVNTIMQRRARWLLSRADELFLGDAVEEPSTEADPDDSGEN